MIELHFLTDNADLRELCRAYWKPAGENVFAFSVQDVASRFSLTPAGVQKLVQQSCKAFSTRILYRYCGSKYEFSNRADFQVSQWLAGSYICKKCRSELEPQTLGKAAQGSGDHGRVAIAYAQGETLDPEKLTLSESVFFLSAMRAGANKSLTELSPLQSFRGKLSPRKSFDLEILSSLYHSGVIGVHSDSGYDAFALQSDPLVQPSLDTVSWILPVDPKTRTTLGLIEAIELALKDDTWLGHRESEVLLLWRRIAVEECIEYLEMAMEDHKLPLSPGDRTRTNFEELIRHYSVAQAYNMIWRAAKDAAAFYVREGVTKSYAAATVPGHI